MSMSNRVCRKCGTPLLPHEVFCSNCGERAYDMPSGPVSGPGNPPSSPYGGVPSYPDPTVPAYDRPYSSGPTSYGTPPYGQGSGEQVNFPPPPPSNPGNYGQMSAQGTPSYVPPPQPGSYPPAIGYPPPGGYPIAPKKKPRVGLIIGIIAIVVVLLCGGAVFAASRLGSSTANSPTPTAQTQNTPAATPTVAQPTPQALFSDNFKDNSKGWASSGGTGFSRIVGDNTLTMFDRNHKTVIESLPVDTTYDDLSVDTTFTFLKGDLNDSLGVYFRGDNNLDHDYRVDIFGDNSYMISKDYLDSAKAPQVKLLVDVTHTDTLKPVGQLNKMTIIAKGSQIALLLNDKLITTVTDPDYTKGQVALFVQNGKTSSEARGSFSSIAIYPAPNQMPTQ